MPPPEPQLNVAQPTIGRAFGRVGLLGNPSDGYQGRVLAMTVPAFAAEVTLAPAPSWDFADTELFAACVQALKVQRPELVEVPMTFGFATTIPRQVGLAGSSALIIAALRALADRCGATWDRVTLAKTALGVETEILDWAAGPQDRVVQAYEGLVDMQFAQPWNANSYLPLDPETLPPLFVAWNKTMGQPSTVEHSRVRERWLAGDRQVIDAMSEFGSLASAGRTALDDGTASAVWPALLCRAFELRSSIWNITSVDAELVEAGTSVGAGVAFAGSGGAVVGCGGGQVGFDELRQAYTQIGAGFLVISP